MNRVVFVKKEQETIADGAYINTKLVLEKLEEDKAFSKKLGSVDTVFIKPNLTQPPDPKLPGVPRNAGTHNHVTTDPFAVLAVVNFLMDRGVKKIRIGESVGWRGKTINAYQKCGYSAIFENMKGVELVELATSDPDRPEERMTVKIPFEVPVEAFRNYESNRVLKDVDLIVNMAKMKTHVSLCVTGALKNYYGFLEPRTRRQQGHGTVNGRFVDPLVRDHSRGELAFSYKYLSEVVCQISAGMHFGLKIPSVDLVEGVLCEEGGGPLFIVGQPTTEWSAMAGYNCPASVDKVMAEYMGFTKETLLYYAQIFLERMGLSIEEQQELLPSYGELHQLTVGEKIGLGNVDPNEINLVLNDEEKKLAEFKFQTGFQPPVPLIEGVYTTSHEEIPGRDAIVSVTGVKTGSYLHT